MSHPLHGKVEKMAFLYMQIRASYSISSIIPPLIISPTWIIAPAGKLKNNRPLSLQFRGYYSRKYNIFETFPNGLYFFFKSGVTRDKYEGYTYMKQKIANSKNDSCITPEKLYFGGWRVYFEEIQSHASCKITCLRSCCVICKAGTYFANLLGLFGFISKVYLLGVFIRGA